eukprot:4007109-Pyramimonas_sp.AAC.1
MIALNVHTVALNVRTVALNIHTSFPSVPAGAAAAGECGQEQLAGAGKLHNLAHDMRGPGGQGDGVESRHA